MDYFSSVDIPEYLPFHLDLQNFDVEKHINLVEENPEINNIKNDLGLIQKELLRVAPFVVKKQFLKYQL